MQGQEHSESELLQIRRDKLNTMVARGIDPFGGRFDTTHQPGALRRDFQPDLEVKVAGRVTARRTMGKAVFFDLSDITGRIQCYVNKKEIGDEAFELLTELVDIGDWLGVSGKTFVTKTGEPSVHTETLQVMSKALRPLPDKWHGVTDREIKYRQRYLDLISNERSRDTFVQRSLMVAEIRRFLQDRGFLEVETPMMQDVPGGAAATPFETFFKALNMAMYLRIAPELFLKRLLVGGFTKIFELNRNFRNEGLSRRHNPEFTMLEAYWAFSDFEQMADLVESMVCHLAEKFCGGLLIEHKDDEGNVTRTINLQRPWRRAPYKELIKGVAGEGWFELSLEDKKAKCAELGVEVSAGMVDYEVSQQVFEKLIEEKSFDPLFVTHVPAELVPLAKQNKADGSVVDVYELVINGQEISPGYSELNDPIVQRERLEHQAGEETQKVDEEFLLALEYGMPSAGGIGIGIDRLVMMLTGAESIRDVVLFPQLKKR
ncbi:lysine--tRNA ligase [Verrucomicrobium sp. BvORR106]|uniref:lysine--tRNA ligase n=1 Tax=Verrucomicrobium sp. BvORR106 TaxID=1403819 RepID=UPI00056DCD28|nr:lysine--tRNA ligase [Verrucomicrobium sp. BvORR106]